METTASHSAFDSAPLSDLPFSAIHPERLGLCCHSVRSEKTRRAVLANARLRGRLADSVFQARKIVPLDIRAIKRMDITAYKAMTNNPMLFCGWVGLASHSEEIAKLIDGDALEPVLKRYSLSDLSGALQLREFAASDGTAEFSSDRLDELIEQTGIRVVRAWARGLPAGLTNRIELMLPEKACRSVEPDPSTGSHARHIVHAVAAQFGNG